MKITVALDQKYSFDLSNPIDISIALDFKSKQPTLFGTPRASSKPLIASGNKMCVEHGASCNVEVLELTPHCNGTHTECLGHISQERFCIPDLLKDSLIPATLISLSPDTDPGGEHTLPGIPKGEAVITRRSLEARLKPPRSSFHEAVVIRTLPNPEQKKSFDYDQTTAPFFTLEAIEFLNLLGVKHLLIDLPSVDRLYDQGKLSAHRKFWGIEPGSSQAGEASFKRKTITELIYVPNEVPDERYLLNLQIPNMLSDAVPSRPILYRVIAENS